MKRQYRILRILLSGKYRLLKTVHENILTYLRIDTEKKIEAIIKNRYNNFKGVFASSKEVHQFLRSMVDDKTYLNYLLRAEKENPQNFKRL